MNVLILGACFLIISKCVCHIPILGGIINGGHTIAHEAAGKLFGGLSHGVNFNIGGHFGVSHGASIAGHSRPDMNYSPQFYGRLPPSHHPPAKPDKEYVYGQEHNNLHHNWNNNNYNSQKYPSGDRQQHHNVPVQYPMSNPNHGYYPNHVTNHERYPPYGYPHNYPNKDMSYDQNSYKPQSSFESTVHKFNNMLPKNPGNQQQNDYRNPQKNPTNIGLNNNQNIFQNQYGVNSHHDSNHNTEKPSTTSNPIGSGYTDRLVTEAPNHQTTRVIAKTTKKSEITKSYEVTTKPNDDEPLFVPLSPNEYQYHGDKIDVAAPKTPKSVTGQNVKSEEYAEPQILDIDLRIKS